MTKFFYVYFEILSKIGMRIYIYLSIRCLPQIGLEIGEKYNFCYCSHCIYVVFSQLLQLQRIPIWRECQVARWLQHVYLYGWIQPVSTRDLPACHMCRGWLVCFCFIAFLKLLEKYYKIVNGSPHSIGIWPHRCRFVTEMLIKSNNLPTFSAILPSSIRRLNIKWWFIILFSHLLFVSRSL